MPEAHRIYLSHRHHPLVYTRTGHDAPILTVENYPKWYGLHVVLVDGTVVKDHEFIPDLDGYDIEAEFERETGEVAGSDHIYNPKFVEFIAEKFSIHLDETSLDMIAGRWYQEYATLCTQGSELARLTKLAQDEIAEHIISQVLWEEREQELLDALQPFVLLNPASPRVKKMWDGFVAKAKALIDKPTIFPKKEQATKPE